MDKKFLSAEEAVAEFGIDLADLQKLVDDGALKALADRGDWKYRKDEIQQLIESGRLPALNPTGTSETPQSDFAFLEIDENNLGSDGSSHTNPGGDFDFDLESSSPEIIGPDSGFASDADIMMIESDHDVPIAKEKDGSSSGSSSELNIIIDEDVEPEPRKPVTEESSVIVMADDDSSLVSDQDVPIAVEKDGSSSGSSSELNIIIDEDAEPEPRKPVTEESSVIVMAADDSSLVSDSDVKVAPEAAVTPGTSSSELPVAGSLSEFDIVMSEEDEAPAKSVTEDSSVILAGEDDSKLESDSDVKVVQEAGSSADVPVAGADFDLAGESNLIAPEGAVASGVSDSDVRIADSGITLEQGTPDSGITLGTDSGLTLEAADSGISLESDSGLTLDAVADSGISLESDSGLSMTAADSGIRLSGEKPKAFASLPDDTIAEFDQIGDSGEQTGFVETFDDSSEDVPAAPKRKGAKSPGLSGSFTSEDEVEDLEIVEDLEAGEIESVEDFETADEEVLEASDDAFSVAEMGEMSDESSIVSSVPVMKTVAREPSWGIVTIIPVAACAFLLLAQVLLLWDGVSTMWNGDTSKAIGASLIDTLSGLM